jgi:uncharacterized membrane protein YdjX (TVP38/TMEM64 family)
MVIPMRGSARSELKVHASWLKSPAPRQVRAWTAPLRSYSNPLVRQGSNWARVGQHRSAPVPHDTKLVVSPPSSPSRRHASRLALAIIVATGLFASYRLGWLQQFADPAGLAHTLVGMGVRGYLVFIIAFALLQPFGIPGTVFVVAAPLIWPWPVAYALSMVGTMLASMIGFSFSRFVARDWVSSRIPERFRRYDEALTQRAFATVFLLRLVFWMPPPLHAFFGVSRVRFWTHFWGSLAGYALPLFLMSYFGQALFDTVGHLPAEAWSWLRLHAGV